MSALHLSILPAAQRALWGELAGVPEHFVLYGGTVIALQLGHRQSVDFDFFVRKDIDAQQMIENLPLLAQCEPLQVEPNTLPVRVWRQAPILLSFFGVPRLPSLRPPLAEPGAPVRLGDLLELAGMEALVVQKRAEAKDYLDVHALLMQAGISMSEMLAAANVLYAPSFTPEITLKSLCYFGDGNLATVPDSVRRDLARAVKAVDPQKLPVL
jgi:hypothetical protein